MIITLVGENDFERRQARDQLVASAVEQYGPHAVAFMDAEQANEQELRERLCAPSLLVPASMVVLQGLGTNKTLAEKLLDLLPDIPETNTLVINEAALDKRTTFYKTLKKDSDFREFPLHDARSLQKWAGEQAAAIGGTLNAREAAQLVDRVGTDQWQLAQEINKLVAFAPEVTSETIERLVEPNLEVSTFALLDATLAGRAEESRTLLYSLRQRSDPFELFGLLAWQMNTLALVVTAPSGLSSAELSRQTGIKPFVLQKSQAIVRRFGATGVRQLVEELATLDLRLKTSGAEPWLLVEQTMATIAAHKK